MVIYPKKKSKEATLHQRMISSGRKLIHIVEGGENFSEGLHQVHDRLLTGVYRDITILPAQEVLREYDLTLGKGPKEEGTHFIYGYKERKEGTFTVMQLVCTGLNGRGMDVIDPRNLG